MPGMLRSHFRNFLLTTDLFLGRVLAAELVFLCGVRIKIFIYECLVPRRAKFLMLFSATSHMVGKHDNSTTIV